MGVAERIAQYEEALDAYQAWDRERAESFEASMDLLRRFAESKGVELPEIEPEPEYAVVTAPLLAGLSQGLFERVQTSVTVDDNGCWIMPTDGYGAVQVAGSARAAHRVTWTWANQQEIPDGHVVDHLCEQKACCNPAHLDPCLPKQNTRRHLLCEILGATMLELQEHHDMSRILAADVDPLLVWGQRSGL